jgi:uncharacterized protein YndB with AHSA1/START domain
MHKRFAKMGSLFVVLFMASQASGAERVLQQSIVVKAPLQTVWQLVSTEEGLKKFAVPNVIFELKAGGRWWSSYSSSADLTASTAIHNEVVAFVPERMLATRIGFPSNMPEVIVSNHRLFAVLLLDRVSGARTRVTETMSGFGDGPEWEGVWNLFEKGNAQTLRTLRRVAETGKPIDWNAKNPYTK